MEQFKAECEERQAEHDELQGAIRHERDKLTHLESQIEQFLANQTQRRERERVEMEQALQKMEQVKYSLARKREELLSKSNPLQELRRRIGNAQSDCIKVEAMEEELIDKLDRKIAHYNDSIRQAWCEAMN